MSSDLGQSARAAVPVESRIGGWIRRYPPLLPLAVVVLIVVVILPSSLNVPHVNPTTVLEYAPVPPEDSDRPPPNTSGGLGALGLPGSSTLSLTPEVERNTIEAAVKRPLTKKCIGGRQTEDLNSPPCQPFFEGDNGGVTWQGVSRDEVTVLIYQHSWTATLGGSGTESPPPGGTYCDTEIMDCDGDRKPDPNPHSFIRIANAYSRYFNARFQTYNRKVHVWMYWANKNTASGRRADAADNWARLKPFAVLDQAGAGGFHEEYVDSMAKRNVMVFASFIGQPATFYQKYAPRVWSFWPSIEIWSKFYTGFACDYVKGTKVSRSAQFSGRDRVYGIVSTSDPQYQPLHLFAREAKKGLESCGIYQPGVTPEVTFPYNGWAVDTQGDRTYADRNVAQLNGAGVNTLLWLGGVETDQSKAMERQGYYPEIIGAGDSVLDAQAYSQVQGQTAWSNAWLQSYVIPVGRPQEDPSYHAYKEAEPDGVDWDWAATQYRDWFMLFTAIQVAGPKLSPTSVDAGMHAIQRKDSTAPNAPALYFLPADYTFVKDAFLQWYDASAQAPDGSQGCHRMVRVGKRYSSDVWKSARGAGLDQVGYNNPSDPCNGYTASQAIRPGTPGPPGS